jgi:hypothetical protein
MDCEGSFDWQVLIRCDSVGALYIPYNVRTITCTVCAGKNPLSVLESDFQIFLLTIQITEEFDDKN